MLKDAGLVIDRPVGNRRIYEVNPAGLEQLRAEIDQFWSNALDGFKSIVERSEKEQE